MGSKFEYNDYTEFEYQPSAKLLLNIDNIHVLWGSVSRAVSTPSRSASDAYLDLNNYVPVPGCFGTMDPRLGCIILVNDKNIDSSVIISSEVGYRWRIRDNLYLDTTLFYDDYDLNEESNKVEYIYGLETNVKYSATEDWKLEFSYTFHDGKDATGTILSDVNLIPRNTFFVRSLYNLGPKFEIDMFFSFVDETTRVDNSTITPDYSRLDLRLGYKFNKNLYLSILGSNLLDEYHTEANYDPLKANTAVERAVQATISYRF